MSTLARVGFFYLNPFYWMLRILYTLFIKLPWWLFCLPWNTVKGCWKAWTWTMETFESWYARTAVASIAIFTAIPGTWTAVFYWLAHQMGYGDEADWVLNATVGFFKAMWGAAKFAWAMYYGS